MLAGLATQSLTVGAAQTGLAFATAAVVFVGLIVGASLLVARASISSLRPLRMSGPLVKRWSGYVLIGVGAWFIVLAGLTSPILV